MPPKSARIANSARARWTLTFLAALFLLTFILGGFGSIAYAWPTGRIGLGPRGLTIFHYTLPRTDPIGLFTTWDSSPHWFHAAWWRFDPDLVAFGSSLLVPGVALALFAAARWYRHLRPFHRRGRTNRAYQFLRLRWLATLAALLTLAAALAGSWRTLEWTTPYHRISIGAGRLLWTGQGESSVSWIGTFTAAPIGPASSPPAYFILYEWLRPGNVATLELSLWFLVTLLAALAAVLWFIRLRFYPTDGRCTNPTCGYDLTGLDHDAPCPECGRSTTPPTTTVHATT